MSDITFVAEPSPFMHINERATVREHFDSLENYFPIYKLPGKHFKPDMGAFYDRILHPGSRTYCNDNGLSVVHNGIHIGLTAVVFEVEGCIHADHCFLSADGDRQHPMNVEDGAYQSALAHFTSCWLELQRIARHADSGIRMDEFIAPKCDGPGDLSPAYLQVSWAAPVKTHIEGWQKNSKHANEACSDAQFEWSANIVAYVSYLFSATKPPSLPKDAPADAEAPKPFPLRAGIPLFGPLFVPPSYIHLEKRSNVPMIEPKTAYLKSMHIVHPFYYPQLSMCHRCSSDNIQWDGWTSSSPREVYGVQRGELALGYQLRCVDCQDLKSKQMTKAARKKITYSCATTNDLFWERWEYWQIPRGAPIFFHKCAVTCNFFDLILEVHLSSTSIGLAENIKFATPIKTESSDYLRTLTAKSVLIDMTFKASKKASISSSNQTRMNPLEGGLFSSINEVTEIMKWKLCQSQSNAEISEFLEGLRKQHKILNMPLPEQFVADNCCHIVRAILCVFPEAAVRLNVFHAIMRYQVAIINSTKNPYRLAVAQDLHDAILIKGASKEELAKYWSKEEQEVKLEAVYNKWARCSSVWHNFVLHCNVRITSVLKDEPHPFVNQTAHGSHNICLANYNAKAWNASIETNNARGYKTQAMPRPELPIVNSSKIFGLMRSADMETYRGLIQLKKEEEEDKDKDKLLRIMDESEVTCEQMPQQCADAALLSLLCVTPPGIQQVCSLQHCIQHDGHARASHDDFVQPDAMADISVDPILLTEDAYIHASMQSRASTQSREKEVFEVEHHDNVVDLTLNEDSAELEDGIVTLSSDSSSCKCKMTDAEGPGNAIKKLKKSPQNAHLFVLGTRLISQAKCVPLFKTRHPPAACSTQLPPNAGVPHLLVAPSILHVSAVPAMPWSAAPVVAPAATLSDVSTSAPSIMLATSTTVPPTMPATSSSPTPQPAHVPAQSAVAIASDMSTVCTQTAVLTVFDQSNQPPHKRIMVVSHPVCGHDLGVVEQRTDIIGLSVSYATRVLFLLFFVLLVSSLLCARLRPCIAILSPLALTHEHAPPASHYPPY
ncbi:hypothetical protein EWM64_g5914 [Hericium alpestre]|uniref:Uncharacterized protein n=1 Tax=Hericium alpestre TaxID=135208 RepID=A0A4Y9ZX68_9AGAM|nr:hypothetical protein EWM64_g5914 [Hericium alpestre]